MPLGVTASPGGSEKPLPGMKLAELVDELERAAEAHRLVALAQLHGDVGLRAVLRVERDLLEPEDDEAEQVHLEVVERRGRFLARLDRRVEWRAHHAVHGQLGRRLAWVGARNQELRVVASVTSPDHSKRDSTRSGKSRATICGTSAPPSLRSLGRISPSLMPPSRVASLKKVGGIERALLDGVERAFDGCASPAHRRTPGR